MPMPHRTQMQIIKRRLTGKAVAERLRELHAILNELPNYRNGPYADIRSWLHSQVNETRSRARVIQRDSIAVRRQGAAQLARVGPPNAGKSSLLHALSNVRIGIGDYAFTTLRPVAALTRIGGVLLQLVEIPGLISGAAKDRGGRVLLGVLRGADAICYCQDASAPLSLLDEVRAEVAAAGIELPAILAATKLDEGETGVVAEFGAATDLPVVGVSLLDDASLEQLQQAIWGLTGLIRVCLQHRGQREVEPLALPCGASVAAAASAIHKDLGAACRGAHLWGPSARIPGQRVGREQRLLDGDLVEILS